jgi:hypothetical protein
MIWRFELQGVKITIYDDNLNVKDPEYNQIYLEEYEPELRMGRQLLAMAKAASPDLDNIIAQRTDPAIKVVSKFGQDEIFIKAKNRERGEEQIEEREVIESPSPVLLVEMAAAGYQSEHDPKAVVVFKPVAGGKLEYVGYVNSYAEDSLDVSGLVGQTTHRLHWFKQDYKDEVDFSHINVSQEYRIDQGKWAYDGDEDIEEVTYTQSSNNVWCYEDIEDADVWESVEPGPPPEDICGYTWTPPGEGGEYTDLKHLFYTIETGDLITYHWPEEFNQEIIRYQYRNEEGAAYRWKDRLHACFDDALQEGLVNQ